MTTLDRDERVAIWNSFFKLAWLEAKAVFEADGVQSADTFDPSPAPLPDGQHHVLAAVVLCNLAIEARANHLIDDLVEKGKVAPDVGKAAQRLPPKHKWFLIPTLAGMPNSLSASGGPHQAIAQLCDLRNDFVHVNYTALQSKLPTQATMLSYFKRFVEAPDWALSDTVDQGAKSRASATTRPRANVRRNLGIVDLSICLTTCRSAASGDSPSFRISPLRPRRSPAAAAC